MDAGNQQATIRFLIDNNMPRSLVRALKARGVESAHVFDLGLAGRDDAYLASMAKRDGYAIMTRDSDFGDVRNYPPHEYHGIAVFDLPNTMHAESIVRVVQKFLDAADVIEKLPGRLAIVTVGQIRLRPK